MPLTKLLFQSGSYLQLAEWTSCPTPWLSGAVPFRLQFSSLARCSWQCGVYMEYGESTSAELMTCDWCYVTAQQPHPRRCLGEPQHDQLWRSIADHFAHEWRATWRTRRPTLELPRPGLSKSRCGKALQNTSPNRNVEWHPPGETHAPHLNIKKRTCGGAMPEHLCT